MKVDGITLDVGAHKSRDNEINKSLLYVKQLLNKEKIDGAIIAGDFNYSKIKWKQEGYKKSQRFISHAIYLLFNLSNIRIEFN